MLLEEHFHHGRNLDEAFPSKMALLRSLMLLGLFIVAVNAQVGECYSFHTINPVYNRASISLFINGYYKDKVFWSRYFLLETLDKTVSSALCLQ